MNPYQPVYSPVNLQNTTTKPINMSPHHLAYQNLKEKLLSYLGDSKRHYVYAEKSLADFYCQKKYCQHDLDIFMDNNIEKPLDLENDKINLYN